MGYSAHFRDDEIVIEPPLNGKAITQWHTDHGTGGYNKGRAHYCAIVLDVAEERLLDEANGDELIRRRAASFHIYGGDDMREDDTISDVRDLIKHADQYDSRVYGTLVQTDGHLDFVYPVRWVVGQGTVEARRPVLLYPGDPDGIGVLAVAVSKHTGVKNDDDLHGAVGGVVQANHWGPDEANSVATDMIRDLYNALKERDA
jgi:hypothetical protein